MFFSAEFVALLNLLYALFFFLIKVIIPLANQGFDFSFNSVLVIFVLDYKCLGAFWKVVKNISADVKTD